IMLFVVPSGAMAQPWSVLTGYLSATVIAIGASHYLDASLMTSALTLGLSLLTMSVLRCLHPPAGGLTLCLLLSEDLVRQQGFMLLLPILGVVTCLLI